MLSQGSWTESGGRKGGHGGQGREVGGLGLSQQGSCQFCSPWYLQHLAHGSLKFLFFLLFC